MAGQAGRRSPRRKRRRARGFSAACLILGLVACDSGNQKNPNAPNAALERRDTEISHEDCDVSSGKGLDANGDGRPDIVQVFNGGREACRAVDINMDTVIDRFVYFDGNGNKRRVESGFDRDTRPDEIAFFEGGQLVRKERETNNDQRIDTWSYYEGGRVVREERDSTGDGYVDQWWQFDRADRPECAIVVTDGDGDGKPDEDSKIDTCSKGDEVGIPSAAPKDEDKPDGDAPDGDAPAGEATPEGVEGGAGDSAAEGSTVGDDPAEGDADSEGQP